MMSINAKARPINDTDYSYHINAQYYNTVIIINKQLQNIILLHSGSTVKPSHVNITLIFLHKATATTFVISLCM